ncbi:hypothetical protein KW787_01665 [Candidatus Pacearchaeota archaeon]|nr:hypothetical protein [Candidatus Pacearchaeota archaeon]
MRAGVIASAVYNVLREIPNLPSKITLGFVQGFPPIGISGTSDFNADTYHMTMNEYSFPRDTPIENQAIRDIAYREHERSRRILYSMRERRTRVRRA